MAQGRKTGGRTAGTPNKANSTLLELVELEAGDPLPVLLARAGRQAMDSGDLQLAVNAWAKAAPFVYPRMQASPPPPVDYVITFEDNVVIPPLIVTDGVAELRGDMLKHWRGPIIEIDREIIDGPANT